MAGVEEFVGSGAAPAERMIRDLVDCEHSYINTDHASFIGGSRAIAQARAVSVSLLTLGGQTPVLERRLRCKS